MKKLLLTCLSLIGLTLSAQAGSLSLLGAGGGSSGGGGALACSYTPVTWGTYSVAYTGGTPSPSGGTGPYSYTVTGTIPTGMTMSSGTGIITGTDSTDSGGAVYPGIQIVLHDNVSATANCGSSFTITVTGGGYAGILDVQGSPTSCWSLRACSAATRGAAAISLCDHSGANCADVLTDATTGMLTGSLTRGSDNCAVLTTCIVAEMYDQTATANGMIFNTTAPTFTPSGLGTCASV